MNEQERIQNEIDQFQEKNKNEDYFFSDVDYVICPYCGHHCKVADSDIYYRAYVETT